MHRKISETRGHAVKRAMHLHSESVSDPFQVVRIHNLYLPTCALDPVSHLSPRFTRRPPDLPPRSGGLNMTSAVLSLFTTSLISSLLPMRGVRPAHPCRRTSPRIKASPFYIPPTPFYHGILHRHLCRHGSLWPADASPECRLQHRPPSLYPPPLPPTRPGRVRELGPRRRVRRSVNSAPSLSTLHGRRYESLAVSFLEIFSAPRSLRGPFETGIDGWSV